MFIFIHVLYNIYVYLKYTYMCTLKDTIYNQTTIPNHPAATKNMCQFIIMVDVKYFTSNFSLESTDSKL